MRRLHLPTGSRPVGEISQPPIADPEEVVGDGAAFAPAAMLYRERTLNMRRLRRLLMIMLIVMALALIVIQLVPVDRSNPPVSMNVSAPERVQRVLRNSCYDCHSNETTWPWYSKVAPVSWYIANDVHEGRKHINFSTWDKYPAEKRRDIIAEAFEEVSEGAMPMPNYLRLHPGARLTDADVEALRQWLTTEGGD
jgi:hypothetical protein